MRKTLTKSKSIYILIGVMLILSIFLSLSLLGQRNIQAGAVTHVYPTDNTGIISIDELLYDNRANSATVGDRVFDFDELTSLFNALSGKSSGATLDDVITEMGKSTYNNPKAGTSKTYVPNTSTNAYSNAFVGSIHYGMNSQDIRTLTGDKDIVVTLGGLEWNVVTLTTTGSPTDVSSGDVVLTLMLKDPISNFSTYWNNWEQTTTVGTTLFHEKYSSTYYSASLIRSLLLNGKDSFGKDVKYSTDASNLTSLSSSQSIPNYAGIFGIFTDISNDMNITDFIVQPRDVLYQQDENLYDIIQAAGASTALGSGQNEASLNKLSSSLGKPTTGNTQNKWQEQFNANQHSFYQQEKSISGKTITIGSYTFNYSAGEPLYFDWGYDYLWLPSWAEVGQNGTSTSSTAANSSITGLWALNNSQRGFTDTSSSDYAWLRTGNPDTSRASSYLRSDGTRVSAYVHTGLGGVRPSLNLNLTAAADSTHNRLETDNVTVEYTGSNIDLDTANGLGLADWYTDSFKSVVNVNYYNESGNQDATGNMIEPGKYKVVFTINDPDNLTQWKDGTSGTKEIVFEIIKKYVPFPTWEGNATQQFSGGNDLQFNIYYDDNVNGNSSGLGKPYFDLIKITPRDVGAKVDTVAWQVTASAVGTYVLDVTLQDEDHYQWKNAPSQKTMTCEVSKRQVNVSLYGSDAATTQLTGMAKGNVDVFSAVANVNNLFSGYDLTFDVKATTSGRPTIYLARGVTLSTDNNEGGQKHYTLDLASAMAGYTYTLTLECTSNNYEITQTTSVTLEVQEFSSSILRWQLYKDGVILSTSQLLSATFMDVNAPDDLSVTFPDKLTYDGSKYEFRVQIVPDGYTQQPYNSSSDYQVVAVNKSSNDGVNADSYTTSAKFTKGSDTYTFSISWEIQPALFDLSVVKWQYDGKVPFAGSNITVKEEIDLTTVPEGLVVKGYGGADIGNAVGHVGAVTVEFDIKSGYEDNYVKPVQGDKTTYKGFGDGEDFEWSKDWSIVPKVISTSSWTDVSHPDSNKNFTVKILSDPLATFDMGIVSYQYFETNSSGSIIDENAPLTVDDLDWTANGVKYYVAKVSLVDTHNYELQNPNAQSGVFRLGDLAVSLIPIQVEPSAYTFEYNTQTRYITVKVTGAGLTNSAFDVKYYEGFTEIDGMKEVGTYRVVITLKSNYTNMYEIKGQYEFSNIQITALVIDPTWNSNAKPPVLNLAYGQINAISYTIIDPSGAEVAYNALQAGVNYRIKAVIKDEYKRSVQFSGATPYETDWQSFSVASNDNLVDPNAPTNPSYPQDNPDLQPDDGNGDNNNPGGNTPGGTTPTDLTVNWNNNTNPPTLSLTAEQLADLDPQYVFRDTDGNVVAREDLVRGQDYTVEVSGFNGSGVSKYNISGNYTSPQTFTYKENIQLDWDTSKNPPELVIPPELEDVLKDVEYEYYDKDGNPLTPEDIANGAEVGGVKVILPDGVEDEYVFVDKNGEIVDTDEVLDPYADQEEPSLADKFKEFLQDYWQVIVCGVALVLIIAFTAKGISYASKRSKIKKQIKKNYTPAYAIALFTAGEKLWNIDYKVWTILAFVLLGVAVLSLIFMILEKSAYKKSKEQLDEAKLEYARNPQAFATAGVATGGAVADSAVAGDYEDGRSSRKHEREMEKFEKEMRKREEELRKREEESRKRDEEERRRRDEEDRRRRDEEDRRRDEEARRREEEFRRQNEEMKMMFMSMMNGAGANQQYGAMNGQDGEGNANATGGQPFGAGQPYGYPPYGYPPYGMPYGPYPYGAMGSNGGTNITIDAEQIRTMITETVSALMPSMQAMLPQQAGSNDEIVRLLAEEIKVTKEEIKNAKEESRKSDERMEKLISKLIEKESSPTVVAAQPTSDKRNDEALEKLAKNQEELAKHVRNLSEKNAEPKVVEKVVEKPVEKIVEKIVEKPVEKIVEKVIEKPVEKFVEVPVVKEVPITVEKLVRVPAEKAAKSGDKGVASSERAPRLTIDEAYAKLSKEQKKFFDTLRTYALGKEKCKEKKSTYYILLGQSSVNPLVKLTIKKDTTVALFKMEDEYFKDLRKNAGSDGTKMKVKETELIVSDAQAFQTAKEMIDLREDQIDRYAEYLKEQRSFKK